MQVIRAEATAVAGWPIDRLGAVAAAGAIASLIAVTGGHASEFQDLYILPMLLSASTQRPVRMAVDTAVILVLAGAPLAYQPAAGGEFAIDLLVDGSVWTVAAALMRVLTLRLHRSRAALRSLEAGVDSLEDAVAVVDVEQGLVVHANPSAEVLASLNGTGAAGLVRAMTGRDPQRVRNDLRMGGPRRYETRDLAGSRWETTSSPVTTGHTGNLVLVGRDVTAAREASEVLVSATRREQQAARELERTVRSQRMFLQAVSHELRTPLTSVSGFATLLHNRVGSLPEEEVARYAVIIERNAARIHRLLDSIMEFERLTRPDAVDAMAWVSLTDLMRTVVEDTDLCDRKVDLTLPDDPVDVWGDPVHLARLVLSLLDNVRRHTPPGTTCWVHLERHERTVELVVDDDGPGIPASHTKAVFAPFRHGPAAEESASPGVGLGLALVAEYARLHGGRAWYEDSPGGGASIHVLLERRTDSVSNSDR